MAVRPRLSPSSIASRYGSQKLVDGMGLGFSASEALPATPNPVVTPLAGFAVAFAFPLLERFSGVGLGWGLGLVLGLGLGLTVASLAASDPVVTSLAGFAGGCRPHAPGGRTAIPTAFR